jgi:hypothetical protein
VDAIGLDRQHDDNDEQRREDDAAVLNDQRLRVYLQARRGVDPLADGRHAEDAAKVYDEVEHRGGKKGVDENLLFQVIVEEIQIRRMLYRDIETARIGLELPP